MNQTLRLHLQERKRKVTMFLRHSYESDNMIQDMIRNCKSESQYCLPERTAEVVVVVCCVGQPTGEVCRWAWPDG